MFTFGANLLFAGPQKVMVSAFTAELLCVWSFDKRDTRVSPPAVTNRAKIPVDVICLSSCVCPQNLIYPAHLGNLISPPCAFFKTRQNFSADVKWLCFYDNCDLVFTESDIINNESWDCSLIPLRWPQFNHMFCLPYIRSNKSIFGFL